MDCCNPTSQPITTQDSPIILVGNPNVGKSVLFGALTGNRVIVSNYPGTTVEITHGTLKLNGKPRPVIDTPGIQSIVPFSDDERVTRDILLSQHPATVVQVVDTKNLRRGLLIALELAEAGLPFVLALNMADEAHSRGISVDKVRLGQILGVPVVSTVAVKGEGIESLVAMLDTARAAHYPITYQPDIEKAIIHLIPRLPEASICNRALALMVLTDNDSLLNTLNITSDVQTDIQHIRREAQEAVEQPLSTAINRQRLAAADLILPQVIQRTEKRPPFTNILASYMAHPIIGWPILAGVLYLIYLFVGVLGAGTLVDLLENRLFGELINPPATRLVDTLIPIPLVHDFLVGQYGLITMAITYGFAIVLPIVGTFFLAFSVLEDSGYLPRLAVMLNKGFQLMGLNGKAVLPMILGLGCTTMATMSTRIMETRKERLQITLLLALGVPCSAQLGVILGMIAGVGTVATLIWLGVVITTLLAVGWLAAQVLPGEQSDFILELPPIRLPSIKNMLLKTASRMEWYLKEVIPIFIAGTVVLFTLDKTGVLTWLERVLSPVVVGWLRLPVEVTGVLLVGFLRRDYGAVGLFDLARTGALSPLQIVTSLVVITLFMPCIATMMMIIKEFGAKTAIGVTAFIFPFAIIAGGLLNRLLSVLHIF